MQALDLPTWAGPMTHTPERSLSLGADGNGFSSNGSELRGIGNPWRALTRSFDAVGAVTGKHAQFA
jgi:chromosome partitioning protein